MSVFSITDAAFEGFRLTRERPRVVGAWAVLYGLMSLVTGLVMILTIGPEFATLRAAARGAGPSDPAEAMRQFRILAPFFLAILPFVVLFWSVLTCAVYRVILRPEEGGFGRLRLGADEVRMVVLTISLWLLVIATAFLSALFVGFGQIMASGAGPLAGFLGNLVNLAALGVTIFVWVRLSLAGPVTFETGQIHLFRSWSLTRGHFWRVAAVYGLAVLLAIVVFLLALVIFTATAGVFVTLSGHPLTDITNIFEPNAASLAAYFTPAQILYQAFWAVLQVVVYAVLLSPAAVIYAALMGRPVNT
jgi:hypothetical protein